MNLLDDFNMRGIFRAVKGRAYRMLKTFYKWVCLFSSVHVSYQQLIVYIQNVY